MSGYHIETSDGEIGHAAVFMVDEKSWAIHELVIETGHWYSAGKGMARSHPVRSTNEL